MDWSPTPRRPAGNIFSNSGSPWTMREVGVAPGPGPVVPPRIRGLAQGVEGLGLLAELSEDAGHVVQDHRVVRAQRHREVRVANRVVDPPHVRVVGGEQGAAAGVLRDLLEVRLQDLDPLQDDVAQRVLLPQGAQRVVDGHVDVVVLAGHGDRGLGQVDHLLVVAGGEERPPQQVVGPLDVALPFDRLAHATHGLVVAPLGVEDPGLGDQDLRRVGAQGARLQAGGLRPLDPRAARGRSAGCTGRTSWRSRRGRGRSAGRGPPRSRTSAARTRRPGASAAGRSSCRGGRGRRPGGCPWAWPPAPPPPGARA